MPTPSLDRSANSYAPTHTIETESPPEGPHSSVEDLIARLSRGAPNRERLKTLNAILRALEKAQDAEICLDTSVVETVTTLFVTTQSSQLWKKAGEVLNAQILHGASPHAMLNTTRFLMDSGTSSVRNRALALLHEYAGKENKLITFERHPTFFEEAQRQAAVYLETTIAREGIAESKPIVCAAYDIVALAGVKNADACQTGLDMLSNLHERLLETRCPALLKDAVKKRFTQLRRTTSPRRDKKTDQNLIFMTKPSLIPAAAA